MAQTLWRCLQLIWRKMTELADHATIVGSGTVAWTKRTSVEERAEAADIAWLRHETTGYDDMVTPRVEGKRREIRRTLTRRSHDPLEGHRRGSTKAANCPLLVAEAEKSFGNESA